jgi:hypothetical protein
LRKTLDIARRLNVIEHRRLYERLQNSVRPVRAYTWRPRTSPRLAVKTGRSPR